MPVAAETTLRYRTHPSLRKRFDRVARTMGFHAETVAEWKTWRRKLTAMLKEITGYNTMISTPPRAKVTEETVFPEYVRQRIELHTEPGVIMPLYMFKPTRNALCDGAERDSDMPARWPVVITPHGHAGGGKVAVAGIADDPTVAERIKQYNYAYGPAFAAAGFMVFAPDARGMGERREDPQTSHVSGDCLWLNQMAISLGQSVAGMWAWDIHRLIDYIETRRDCDANRIGCAGLSGGGLQTLWASALDSRIRCAIISGYLYGFKESLLDMLNCACNYVPHLFELADMGDIAALIAPRSVMIETGDKDSLNGASGLKNVKSQVAIMKQAYKLLGAADHLKHVVFQGLHRWDGQQAIPWMRKWLCE